IAILPGSRLLTSSTIPTRDLLRISSSAPMVLHGRLCGRVGRRRFFIQKPRSDYFWSGLFVV
ncbi:hypothetical protein, partial [Desulfosediminicola sp.]|uniref:hypothetical protein n=1 Tax=Desulfosediminicola sp. TaxID=2886825 RepID=UPI003AF22386